MIFTMSARISKLAATTWIGFALSIWQQPYLCFTAWYGSSRVKRWRSRGDENDAFAFIRDDSIQRDTRFTFWNILMFETYYRDILGEQGEFWLPHEVKAKY